MQIYTIFLLKLLLIYNTDHAIEKLLCKYAKQG